MNHAAEHQLELLQDRYAMRLAARLNEGAEQLPYDIVERLRAARVQALDQRKRERTTTARSLVAQGSFVLASGPQDEGLGWFTRMASLLPLLALVVGLLTLQAGLDEMIANELAEVDSAILTDDLPPAAYADSGFAQFLKISGNLP